MKTRSSPAILVGVAAALAAVALLGATWYDVDTQAGTTQLGSASVSGWQVLDGADVALVLLASAAALSLLVGGRAVIGAGLLAAIAAVGIVIYHVVDPPGASLPGYSQDVTLQLGIWATLAASVVLAGAVAVAEFERR